MQIFVERRDLNKNSLHAWRYETDKERGIGLGVYKEGNGFAFLYTDDKGVAHLELDREQLRDCGVVLEYTEDKIDPDDDIRAYAVVGAFREFALNHRVDIPEEDFHILQSDLAKNYADEMKVLEKDKDRDDRKVADTLIEVFDDYLIEKNKHVPSSCIKMAEDQTSEEESDARIYGTDYIDLEDMIFDYLSEEPQKAAS